MGKLNKFIFIGIFLILLVGSILIGAVDYYKLYPNDETIYVGFLFNVTPKEISYNPLEQLGVVFVPVMSSLEWNQFVANSPPYVTLSFSSLREPNCFTLDHCFNWYDGCKYPLRCFGGTCCFDFNLKPIPLDCPQRYCPSDHCSTRTDCERMYTNCPYPMSCSNGECCGNGLTNCPAACV